MKSIRQFILEELDDNILWMLDKWFERNENQKQEFIEIISQYKTDKNIEELLKDTELSQHLEEFVTFLNNDIHKKTIDNIIYQFENIVKTIIGNKSNLNKYI